MTQIHTILPSKPPTPFRYFRTCYRHPAGQVGVAISDWLFGLAWVMPVGGGYRISNTGLVSLYALGVRSQRLATHHVYGYCTDLTEKRQHLKGDLGAALTGWLMEREWAARKPLDEQARRSGGRELRLTEVGRLGLTSLGVKLPG